MKTLRPDSSKKKYLYLIIGICAIIVGIGNLYYKQYSGAIAMAIVLGGQVGSYLYWKKKQR